MPKKTRREKIIAEYRRKLSTIREAVPMSPERINESPTPRQAASTSPYVYQRTTDASTHTASVVQPMDRAIRRNLVKTLILAGVAIGGEVVLSRILPS